MAKKSMIEREKKRERLVSKYQEKRKAILKGLKTSTSFADTLLLQKKITKITIK